MTGADKLLPLRKPTLYWAMRGSFHYRVNTSTGLVQDGHGLWVPAGSEVVLTPRHGAVVIPIPGLDIPGQANHRVFRFSPPWREALLHAYAVSIGHLEHQASPSDPVHSEFTRVFTRGQQPLAPPFPRSQDLVQWCSRVLDTPGTEPPPAGWHTRTLHRWMLNETGLSPQAWTRAARLARAAQQLTQGIDPAMVAVTAGYTSTSAFSRAFARHTGVSPARWVDQPAPDCDGENADPRAALARIPPGGTWARINGAHVAIWMASGRARVEVGQHALVLEAGQGVVLPAGHPNKITFLDPGTVLLPVGYRPGASLELAAPRQATACAPEDTELMIGSSAACYGGLPHPGIDPGYAFNKLSEPQQATDSHGDWRLLSRLASAVGEQKTSSLEQLARTASLEPARLSQVLEQHTGLRFAQWKRRIRMTRARGILLRGASPGHVARSLGYAHPSAFTRAFSAVHGRAPSGLARDSD